LIASEDGSVVAAIHAGWRGVIAGVVPHAVTKMRADDMRVDSLIAAVGPCIGFDAFEVGVEVVEQFEQGFGSSRICRRTLDGKSRVDLRAAIALQLARTGISQDRIDTTDRCTFRDCEEFFSHRRDRGITGRMAALIAPKRG
jgi:hypothetical protein